jgi:hypothetical protein
MLSTLDYGEGHCIPRTFRKRKESEKYVRLEEIPAVTVRSKVGDIQVMGLFLEYERYLPCRHM